VPEGFLLLLDFFSKSGTIEEIAQNGGTWMITEDTRFYLPNLYTFQNGNSYYGSYRGLRFFLESAKQDDQPIFDCKVWYGEYCLEESQVVDTAVFPMDEEGHQSVLHWLDAQYNKMLNAANVQADAAVL
jgi:hypothetical protein